MLALAIITTILEAFVLIKCVADIPEGIEKCTYPVAGFIGSLIGIAIRCIPIITVWVFYNRL